MKKKLYIALAVAAGLLVAAVGAYGFSYVSSPSHIREPAFEHYHFRTQIVVNGKPVDFSADRFQEDYDSGSCSAELSAQPMHFHDNIDQMTHIHWDGMTGGEFLKYYGWNLTGGGNNSLGYRFDGGFPSVGAVKIHGDVLPDVPKNTNFYVYIGDENGYEQKNWNDFLDQDLEVFFGKQSNLGHDEQTGFNFLDWLIPKAHAHGDAAHSHEGDDSEKTKEELTRINNLIGNVVIFVQENEPTDEQIRARFNNLVPLQDSTCGG